MINNQLLSCALHSRKSYEELLRLKALRDFPDKQKIIIDLIQEYYNSDPAAKCADKEIIKSSIARKYPKHSQLLQDLVDELKPVSDINVVKEVVQLRKQKVAEELAAALMSPKGETKVVELLTEYEALRSGEVEEKEETRVYVGKPVTEVVAKTSGQSRIKLWPEEVQEATGGALRGHHILVFAIPDCGKTTLAINMAYGFLKQGLKTLYVINEDPIDDVNRRMLSRLAHKPLSYVEEHPEEVQRIVDNRNYDKFILAELTPGTPTELVNLVEKYKPDVLIVDQSRNIEYSKLSKVESLEKIERFIRQLGKKYDMLTVSFTQAGDSAHGKLILKMGDVDWSNTGMQASADLMIGMGVNDDYEQRGRRMLSFPKNKLSGDKAPREVVFNANLFKIGGSGR
jgi:KaiC/GvpD/RAD55 family RecA-like ATPase